MTPIVSIIIPAYNAVDYIHRTVDSVKGQSYQDWELIIVNDGSTDTTGDAIEKIASSDTCIKCFHQSNGGEVAARRKGVLNAAGEWVMFVDADDCLPTTAIESLVVHKDKADIIAGTMRVKRIDHTGSVVEDYIWRNRKEGLLSNIDYANGIFLYEVQMSACAKLYKRQLFEPFEWCMDRTIRQNPDLLMNIGIGAMAKDVFVTNDAVCYDYIIHEGSASTNGMMEDEAWFSLFDRAQQYMELYPDTSQLMEAFCHYRLERVDSMMRHGVFNASSTDTHVEKLLTDCEKCSLSIKERQTTMLLRSQLLRKLFYWWQERKK